MEKNQISLSKTAKLDDTPTLNMPLPLDTQKNQLTSKQQHELAHKTTCKKSAVKTSLKRAVQHRSKVVQARKRRKMLKEEELEPISLYDTKKKVYRKLPLYWDDIIGIKGEEQNLLIEQEFDEDSESTDEIIEYGIKKGIEHLEEAIRNRKQVN